MGSSPVCTIRAKRKAKASARALPNDLQARKGVSTKRKVKEVVTKMHGAKRLFE
jgi:hypothetical protein